jgi:membrane protein implicated in regulation of membrane protease activity
VTHPKIEVPVGCLHISRLHTPLAWLGGSLFVLLAVHVVLSATYRWPIAYLNLDVGVAFFICLSAVLIWCTNRLIREVRKERKKLRGELKQLYHDALDEGHIVGLAAGLADLSSSIDLRNT